MPGISFDPRGVSEYDRSFKWTGENITGVPFAGKQSAKMLQCNEPPLQHKRRINPHQDNKIMNEDMSARSQENNVRSEILLGGKKNQKFGPSVVHVMKSKVRAREQDENGPPPPPPVDLRLPREASRDVDEFQAYQIAVAPERPSPPKFSESSPRPSDTPPRRYKKREQRRQTRKSHTRKKEAVRFETMENNNNKSSVEPPENYAKQHKLGLKHAWRETKANHLTEYGRQFEWRPSDHQSPILKAEDIIFRSHLDMPKEAKVSDTTEYRRQFKAFRYDSVPKTTNSPGKLDEQVAHRMDKALKPQPAALVPRVVVEGKTFAPSEVLNPQRMSFPLGRQRNYLSEYNANFRSFVGERSPAPAHLLAGESQPPPPTEEGDINKLWFEEIMELRRRAEEYKLRARGTHFSRDHVAKIIGRPSVSTVQREPVMEDGDEDEDGQRTPRNEEDERQVSAQRPVGRHHLARTTPCTGGVILSPETAQPQTDRTETSMVVGKPRNISRTDNPALRLAGQPEIVTGLKLASSGHGTFQTAGKPTIDTDQLRETWVEPRRDDVIYEGFGETYNVPQPEEGVRDIEDIEEEEVASTLSNVSSARNGDSFTNDRRVTSIGSGRKEESIISGQSVAGSSRSSIRVWTPPLPPQGPSMPLIDDDVASTLESVRSIVSSSSQLAEETLERAKRNQEKSWTHKR